MSAGSFRTAFILGAGLGTRLRPLTERCPKPLLPVGGRPLITYAMAHLRTVGIERFIVNTHHCPDAYARAFPEGHWHGIPVILRYEPILLDTGGGLKNIEELLGDEERLLVCNGDIITDLPLEPLLAAHEASGTCAGTAKETRAGRRAEVTLALRSDGPLRNVSLDATGTVCDLRHRLGIPGAKLYQFTGIYAAERSFLARIEAGRIESVVEAWLRVIREGWKGVRGIVIDDGTWHDLGTVAEYERICRELPLTEEEETNQPPGSGNVPAACLAGEVPDGAASPYRRRQPCPAGTTGGKGVAGAATPQLGEAVRRFVGEALGLASETPISLEPITRGGSDRTFTRCRAGGGRFILMQYGTEREENALYVPIGRFLAGIGIRTPDIIAADPAQRFVLLEDLGEQDLWSQRDEPWDVRRIPYGETLAMAARLHAFPPKAFPAAEVRLMPAFDAGLYRWERDYFLEQFVAGVCRLKPEPPLAAALEEELAALAQRLLAAPPCLIHRDLQSQNVMIAEEGQPALIDFQGMRWGSAFYDVASLLYDPYVSFTEDERLFLFRTYIDDDARDVPCGREHLAGVDSRDHDDDFIVPFREAAVQRLMQALGAYGFLGMKKGKQTFLGHIPRALDHLEQAAAPLPGLPRLKTLLHRCRRSLRDIPPSL